MKKLLQNLEIEQSWQFVASAPVPDGVPVSLTTGLSGPQATMSLPEQGVVLHLSPMDVALKINGAWIVLNAPAAQALLEDA